MAPFPQLVYNGVFAMNPFTRTVNFTAQTQYWQLKLIEFGGRPAFYFYSKFTHGGNKGWMGDGDLGCATDAELAASVAKIKEGADVYAKLSPLQYEFMEEHDDLGGGKIVRALVPLAEMFGYSTELRSSTQGRGNYSMFFERYEQAPKSIQEKVVAAQSK